MNDLSDQDLYQAHSHLWRLLYWLLPAEARPVLLLLEVLEVEKGYRAEMRHAADVLVWKRRAPKRVREAVEAEDVGQLAMSEEAA